MKIISDFQDYYDTVATQFQGDNIILHRNNANRLGKMDSIKFMKSLGIETIELCTVSQYMRKIASNDMELVVVYTDEYGHSGNGKVIMKIREAYELYSSYYCSKFEHSSLNKTYKILQIGYAKYSIIISNDTSLQKQSLVENKVDEIKLLGKFEFNYSGCLHDVCPIHSIDYVRSDSGNMLACDFNVVQRLDTIGLNEIIKDAEVVNSLYEYYKYNNN